MKVVVRNGNVEQAMRVLKKKLMKDGRLKELKERQYYVKPSEDKREAKKINGYERLLTVFYAVFVVYILLRWQFIRPLQRKKGSRISRFL